MSAQKAFWLGSLMTGVLVFFSIHGLYLMALGGPKEKVLVGPVEFVIGIGFACIAAVMACIGYSSLPPSYSVGRRLTVGLMLCFGVALFIGTQYVPFGGFVLFGAGVVVVAIAFCAMTTINEQPLRPPVPERKRAF